jgi:hypothetical protein
MNGVIGAKAPAWLRIVAALGLVWNLIGVYFYLVQVGMVAAPAGEPPMSDAMPPWVTGAFAISVFGGVLGCVGLLMLKGWSRALLYLSLLAVIGQDVWAFLLREHAADEMGGGKLWLTLAVNLIAILLAWLAYSAGKKGWLS